MPINNGWLVRAPQTNRQKVTWAAVALALISLAVQLLNFYRADLKPVLELGAKNQAALERIEKRLDDHERRIAELEKLKGRGK